MRIVHSPADVGGGSSLSSRTVPVISNANRPRSSWKIILYLLLASGPYAAYGAPDLCQAAYWDSSQHVDLDACIARAKAGGPNAEFGYAMILWSGHGRPSDHKTALTWLRKSARQGHYLAQITLGRFLSDRDVEPGLRNPIEAYAWWFAAGATQEAKKLLVTLNGTDARAAEQLGNAYRAKYAQKRPAVDGP